jgi:hypothetical protein
VGERIAFCGLDCAKCDAFVAARDNDDALRARIAERWSGLTGRAFSPLDVDCGSCSSSGPHPPYLHECPIRACAGERRFATCAACEHCPCADLEAVHRRSPSAAENLERLHSGGHSTVDR